MKQQTYNCAKDYIKHGVVMFKGEDIISKRLEIKGKKEIKRKFYKGRIINSLEQGLGTRNS